MTMLGTVAGGKRDHSSLSGHMCKSTQPAGMIAIFRHHTGNAVLFGFSEDGVDGMIVESGDTENLALSIERLADDEELPVMLGARARAKAENRYSVRGMVDSYAHLFEEMR